MRTYEGSVNKHKDIKEGDQVKIVAVSSNYENQYPPVGTVLTVMRYAPTGETVLYCNEYSYRTGVGLTYVLVSSTAHLKGIAKFLKEKGL